MAHLPTVNVFPQEADLPVGSKVFCKFFGEKEWHGRYISFVCSDGSFYAISPDEDHYHHPKDDVEVVVVAGNRGGVPARIRASGWRIQNFDFNYDEAQLANIIAEGKTFARQEGKDRVTPRVPLPIAPATPFVASDWKWIGCQLGPMFLIEAPTIPTVVLGGFALLEVNGVVHQFERVNLRVNPGYPDARRVDINNEVVAAGLGGAHPTPAEAPAAQDARVLPIAQRGGERFRTWASVVESCNSEDFGDWPVRGPRTTKFCMDFMAKRLTPLDHHLLVKSTAKLNAEQWGVQEHELLLRLCEVAGTYDQLDLSNLAWVEIALRRVQTIEWVYHEKLREPVSAPGNLSMGMEELAAFAGINKAGEVMMVSPLLLDHVKSEVERDVVIMKNLRKAREERDAKKAVPKK